MIRAAGVLFALPDGRVLLMHRTGRAEQDGDAAGLWAFPGGKVEDGENAEQAARREVEEETGLAYKGDLTLWTRRIRDDVDFTTFLARVDEFVPTRNDEHDTYQWMHRSCAWNMPWLHPGCNVALARFDMDELGVARAMVAGELTSPQYYGKDLMLVALRITGTGASYRASQDEYVWRDPSIYMNEEFLARCNGLPVIFRHPEKSMLNTEEFRARIVGTIFVPYLREDAQEAWGIAKILDMQAAKLLESYEMSTSPAVLCLGPKIPVDDGRHVLIEHKPFLLDHLAILIPDTETGDTGEGVWDKGGPLSGVESVDALPLVSEEANPLDVIVNAMMNQKIDELCQRLDRI